MNYRHEENDFNLVKYEGEEYIKINQMQHSGGIEKLNTVMIWNRNMLKRLIKALEMCDKNIYGEY